MKRNPERFCATDMKIVIRGKTDVGLERQLNEDSFGIVGDKGLAVVCDGMGGHAAGEVASESAVETILRLHREFNPPPGSDAAFELAGDITPEGRFLAASVRIANSMISRRSATDPSTAGMGTTVVAALFHDGLVSICHVGDSRAYRISNGMLRQLTVDHSWVGELIAAGQMTKEEARNFPQKNVITRALGVRPKVKVDIYEDSLQENDRFLLCTDGLIDCATEDEIFEISSSGDTIEKRLQRLIDTANAGGGDDNITCIMIDVLESGENEKFGTPVTFTFPEETDSELDAQDKVCDMILSEHNAASAKVADEDTDEFDTPDIKSGGGGIPLVFFLSIAVLAVAACATYYLNLGGARDVISSILGS